MRLSTAATIGAVLAVAVAWSFPLAGLDGAPFTTHMVRHMLLVAVAAPLVALAVSGHPFDPVRRAPWAFAPMPVSIIELGVVWGWHVPALHHAAQGDAATFALEQASVLLSGVWLWLAILGGSSLRRTTAALPGLAALTVTVAHKTLLGVLLSLSPRAFYHQGFGDAALVDQQHGGAVMLAATAVAGVVGALILGRRVVRAVARAGLESA